MEPLAKSIFDFGAIGDGKADDTGAFAAAMSGGNKKITVPFGIYRIISTVFIESFTELVFENGARVVCETGDKPCFSNKPDARSFEISGAGFDGTKSDAVLSFENASDVVICNVTFVNCPRAIKLERIEGFLVSGIRFSYFGNFSECVGTEISAGCKNGIISDVSVLNENALFGTLVFVHTEKGEKDEIKDISVVGLSAMRCHRFVSLLSYGARIARIRSEGIFGGTNCAISIFGKNDALFSDISFSGLELFSENTQKPLFDIKANLCRFEISFVSRPGVIDNRDGGFAPTLGFFPYDQTRYCIKNVSYDTIQKINDSSKLSSRGINPRGYDIADFEGFAVYGDRLIIPDGGYKNITFDLTEN